MDDLRFVRIFVPDHIPKDLVEQIKDRDFEVDKFFKFLNGSLMIQGKNGLELNPLNHVYVVSTPENIVVGYLWFTIDSLSNHMFVQHFSMKKEYWESKKSIPMLKEFLTQIKDKASLSKVFWLTSRPKAYEKYGFKRAKQVLLEAGED